MISLLPPRSRQRGFFTLPAGLGIVRAPGVAPAALYFSTFAAGVTLSESDRRATRTTGTSSGAIARANLSRSTGKRYVEFEYVVDSAADSGCGLCNASHPLTSYIGSGFNSWGLWKNGPSTLYHSSSSVLGGSAWSAPLVIMLAWDAGAQNLWFGKNGTWLASGDPGAGTGANATGVLGTLFPAVDCYGNTQSWRIREASSYSYSPPSGFSPWEA